jgi:diguanylate cyclase (GGDEF)-like protein
VSTERTAKALDFLEEIVGVCASNQQYERTFHYIVDRLVRIYGCQTCAILLIDPATEYLNIENSHGLSWTFCKAFRRRLATGSVGRLIWTGTPILLEDAAREPDLAAEMRLESPLRSCACVHIGLHHRSLGYLHLDSREPGAFSTADLRVLKMFADLSAIALHKTRLGEENLRLDRIDHETGLERYGPFMETLQKTRERAHDLNENFAVLLLDVDNFKTIVNTFGDDASRKFLAELGAVVSAHLRPVDVAARYGPDEIILLLCPATIEEAVASARRLREDVERRRFTARDIASTVSIGVAAYPLNGRTTDDIMQTAKSAVFEAQRAGRNKVLYYVTEWYSRDAVLHEQ